MERTKKEEKINTEPSQSRTLARAKACDTCGTFRVYLYVIYFSNKC